MSENIDDKTWKDRIEAVMGIRAKDIAKKYGMLSIEEVELLQLWTTPLPSKAIVVNIGANVGTSTCAILEANPTVFIFSIDIKPYPEEFESLKSCGLPSHRVVRLLGDSAEIGCFFPYKADLIFVDGAHHDEAVRADIEVWLPKCTGIMAFHDYHHPRYADKSGVHLDQIVDEAMRDWERLGEARYLVGFRRKNRGE